MRFIGFEISITREPARQTLTSGTAQP